MTIAPPKLPMVARSMRRLAYHKEVTDFTIDRRRYPFYHLVPKNPIFNKALRVHLREAALTDYELRDTLMYMCRKDTLFWINLFTFVFEPRPKPQVLPFLSWPHQDPCISEMERCLGNEDVGIDKSRGEGASWMVLMLCLKYWLFGDPDRVDQKRFTFGVVSRNELAVDDPNDPDSLLWKIQFQLDHLPKWMVPKFDRVIRGHSFTNLETGSSIVGYAATGDVASGGRKAQPLDAKILTPQGWTLMGKVKAGDKIIGSNGRSIRVDGVYPLGERDVFQVTFNDGVMVECCDEHLWSITEAWQRQSKKDHDYHVVPLSEIREKIILDRGDGARTYNYQIPIISPVTFDDPGRLPACPYLIGCLLGDGNLGISQSSISISTADEELLELLRPLLPKHMRFVYNSKYDYRISRIPGSGLGKRSPLKDIIRELGLADTKSEDKFIPDVYMFAGIGDRLEMLRGLMDTDGWVALRGKKAESCRVKFCSTSKKLAEGVRFLVQSFGGVATMSTKENPAYEYNGEHRIGRTAYEITICMPPGMNPFKLSRKASKYRERTKYGPRRSIIDVRHVGKKQVQCIKVDAEDNLYATDGCVLTHNTAFIMDEMAKFPKGSDYDAMSSTQFVTDCRIVISTFKGNSGYYYDAMRGQGSSLNKIILDWKDNPTRNRGMYRIINGNIVPLDPNYNRLPLRYRHDVAPLLERLRGRGYSLDEKIRSPWYDRQCDRTGATPQSIAEELDRDPERSGSPFFDPDVIARLLGDAVPPLEEGELDWQVDSAMPTGFLKRQRGSWRLWCRRTVKGEPPHELNHVLGIDIAAGGGGSLSSNSAISVMNDRGEKVAEFASPKVMPHELAKIAHAAGHWFAGPSGPAYMVFESNGPTGIQFTRAIRDMGYPHLYHDEVETQVGRKKTRRLGFFNQGVRRGSLYGDYRQALTEGKCSNPSREALEECRFYEHQPGGGIEHVSAARAKQDPSGAGHNHGDRATADALAWRGLTDIRPERVPDQLTPEEITIESIGAPQNSFLWRKNEADRLRKEKQLR